MIITHKIKMDLSRRGLTPLLNMVQGDSNTRAIEITLLNNGSPWEIPAGTTAVARYQKKGGAAGLYDIMEDGSNAWSVTKPNVVTIYVASQVLTQKGSVFFTVSLVLGNAVISMFHMVIEVEPCSGYEGGTEEPEPDLYQQILQNYVMLTCRVNNLSTLKEGSTTGDAELQDIRLGYNGQIYANAGEAVRQQVAAVAAGIEEVRQNSSILTATEKNLILRLLTAAAYTSDQSKTIQALQQTFASTSDVEYTVANNLTNVQTDNNLTKVTQYAAYVATLTPADGCELDSVTVLMGGVDVTKTVYADGEIYIPVVTGAIVITATATEGGTGTTPSGKYLYRLENRTFDGTSASIVDTELRLLEEDTSFTIMIDATQGSVNGVITDANHSALFVCTDSISPWTGISAQTKLGGRMDFQWGNQRDQNMVCNPTGCNIKLVLTHKKGSNNATFRIKIDNNSVNSITLEDAFASIERNFAIGGSVSGNHAFIGTMHSFTIYNEVKDDATISAFLA